MGLRGAGWLVLAVLAAGCGASEPESLLAPIERPLPAPGVDGGLADGGLPDAGGRDAGSSRDAGVPDAGRPPLDGGSREDAGTADAGAQDAGAPDAGAPDAGAPDGGCVPETCSTHASGTWAQCGTLPDGCGGTLQCDTCPEGQACGGAFRPNVCAPCLLEEDLGNSLPVQRSGTPRHEALTSVDGNASELTLRSTFVWTAPRAGTYVISNAGSGPASDVSVRAGHCNGTAVPASSTAHPDRYVLAAGQQLFITLWGRGGRLGWVTSYFQLRIHEAAPSESGLCADRLDNDGDGRMDCWDAACAGAPACATGTACTDRDLGSALPARGEGPTERYTFNSFSPTCGPAGREDWVLRWSAPVDGRYVFHAHGFGYTLAAWSGCRGTQLACVSGYDEPGPDYVRPVLVRDVRAGETLLLVLQGSEMDDELPLAIPSALFIHPWVESELEGLCEDGRDNDGDGRVDEDDPGCPNYREW